MKNKIGSEEKIITGEWLVTEDGVTGDETCIRIRYLTKHYLQKVAADNTGWNTLYKDPHDGRFWVMTYPQSEMHGGGPPQLHVIKADEAKSRFGIH